VKGISAEEVAQRMDLHISYVYHAEKGRKGVLGPGVLRKFADALNCSYVDMMIHSGHLQEEEIIGWVNEREKK
jgi:transcriptional regulator with XRE-family HTH domain